VQQAPPEPPGYQANADWVNGLESLRPMKATQARTTAQRARCKALTPRGRDTVLFIVFSLELRKPPHSFLLG
jgi:hypothetical protein